MIHEVARPGVDGETSEPRRHRPASHTRRMRARASFADAHGSAESGAGGARLTRCAPSHELVGLAQRGPRPRGRRAGPGRPCEGPDAHVMPPAPVRRRSILCRVRRTSRAPSVGSAALQTGRRTHATSAQGPPRLDGHSHRRGLGLRARDGLAEFDPDHPDQVGVSRGTVWEIHSVTKLEKWNGRAWTVLGE